MTAALTDSTPLAPGVGLRAFRLDGCRHAGVVLDPEQEALLITAAAHNGYVMCAVALPDPMHQHRASGVRPPRLLVYDDPRAAGHTVVIPMAGVVDWSNVGVELVASMYGPHWARFPSVPVELIDPIRPGLRPFWPDMVRVWNAWPIEASQVNAVLHSTASVIGAFGELVDIGDEAHCIRDACEIVYTGVKHEHKHVSHPLYDDGQVLCVTGERVMDQLRAERLWTGHDKPKEFGEQLQPHPDIADAWERLVASSRRNTAACLEVVPPWDRSELTYLEEEFTPWL